jgi:uncharacterized membrane protein YhaH (DUF805 family)
VETSVFACYLAGWKKCFVYQGNASRKEFWSFIIGNLLIVLLVLFLNCLWWVYVYTTLDREMALIWVFGAFFSGFIIVPLLLLLPVISLGIRRMHDIGKSGWWFGGAVVINLIIFPVIHTGIAFLLSKSMGYDDGHKVASIISTPLSLMALVFLLWLCCQPTKIKTFPSSLDVTN